MDDIAARARTAQETRPRLDLQEHLADLEARGLLTRIDHPVDKDTELHPLVRLQFIGGIPEARAARVSVHQRDRRQRPALRHPGGGRRHRGLGGDLFARHAARRSSEIGAGLDRRRSPNRSRRCGSRRARCQEVVITGDALRAPDGGLKLLPVPISTPGFDAAPYLTATLCITKDPETGIQNIGTYRAALKATDRLVVRMVARAGGAGGYVSLAEVQGAQGRRCRSRS